MILALWRHPVRVMEADGMGDGHEASLCGARRRQSDGTCRKQAGWGTDHFGFGRCRLHGGATPA